MIGAFPGTAETLRVKKNVSKQHSGAFLRSEVKLRGVAKRTETPSGLSRRRPSCAQDKPHEKQKPSAIAASLGDHPPRPRDCAAMLHQRHRQKPCLTGSRRTAAADAKRNAMRPKFLRRSVIVPPTTLDPGLARGL
jgi:hypothetical protein